ncbi:MULTISPECIES: Crp/Fnr family transcriptional regulator [Sphingobacterium]|jgi:CRP-like cAMP-binding protein|uniref:Crp/Fnr family transcriptional regulator n=1 Tax=Sphingobacterium kitahiroshimense TaxID=470446 RepID=A0ABV0BSZ6_9SPHI|nr:MULTISPECIES: Crp/Fnr family transcriptional regulator [Sphingobacterium]MBB2949844.1 CRP-like cAMP-binding protein [Sphingobacterium sp. JUb56]MCW2263716.1 CRP-like cAMP-binding protein [Sphingobacterium kitahiroshimense]NJI73515.1 Crp/Fnr family transcriptional regulator [Sphingobacterium sp. B16(2022)]QQD13232.1 Crp/Fnr family transcriptional regulator [Sphingobacterium sp. UDSM-2020]TCR03806.1 CRP-like cAMP-binding protein [Sphingobacterium sp. JUb78]
MDDFLKQINAYYSLSEETADALKAICKIHSFKKNDLILRAGDMARYYYYVRKGLLGYYTINESGNTIFKLFFEENSFVASTAAIIEHKPSLFHIIALEDCEVIMYPAQVFRELLIKYHDLALFHIHYLEKNWVVKKEPLEIDLKWDTAKIRYIKLYENQKLFKRLKQHHIASYLGITPTQLSRIRKELNF